MDVITRLGEARGAGVDVRNFGLLGLPFGKGNTDVFPIVFGGMCVSEQNNFFFLGSRIVGEHDARVLITLFLQR